MVMLLQKIKTGLERDFKKLLWLNSSHSTCNSFYKNPYFWGEKMVLLVVLSPGVWIHQGVGQSANSPFQDAVKSADASRGPVCFAHGAS